MMGRIRCANLGCVRFCCVGLLGFGDVLDYGWKRPVTLRFSVKIITFSRSTSHITSDFTLDQALSRVVTHSHALSGVVRFCYLS
jgi:hypothetical protein